MHIYRLNGPLWFLKKLPTSLKDIGRCKVPLDPPIECGTYRWHLL